MPWPLSGAGIAPELAPGTALGAEPVVPELLDELELLLEDEDLLGVLALGQPLSNAASDSSSAQWSARYVNFDSNVILIGIFFNYIFSSGNFTIVNSRSKAARF